MFTGIIEEIGTIVNVTTKRSYYQIQIKAEKILDDLQVDHSVSVNGVCLTAVRIDDGAFTADAVTETLSKTNISAVSRGTRVNLERALRLQDRMGGHFVQGHVDGLGTIMKIETRSDGNWLEVDIPAELQRYTIPKGSICVNGVSLTIAGKSGKHVTMAVIPHTMSHTTFMYAKAGDRVNVEVDFFAKYIEQFIHLDSKNVITKDWLKSQGY
jgi:riboflavin synthase